MRTGGIHAASGFTLVEVLAALVIVSLGMLGVIEAVSQTASSSAYLRDKTIAHWVGMNRVTEVRLESQPPSIAESSDEVEMGGRKWRWNMEVTQTAVESIRRIDVSVALADAPKDSSLASVTGFYGAAVDQPGITGALWPGGAPGGGPGGNPNDPNNPQNPDPNNPADPNNPNNPNDPNTPAPGGDPPQTEPEPVPPAAPEPEQGTEQ
jgi:general secretion pathway protein I